MLTTELTISIPGHPAPKGSMKCVGRNGRHQLVEQVTRGKEWRTLLAYWIKRKWHQHADTGQEVGIEVTFTIPRPTYHYGSGRNAGQLKERHADALPVGHNTGDVDKLARLVLDALQDTPVLPDDSAVCELTTRKAYVAEHPDDDVLAYPGVVIRLYPL